MPQPPGPAVQIESSRAACRYAGSVIPDKLELAVEGLEMPLIIEAPYRPQNLLSMVYQHLGIDPALTFADYSGRPRYVLEECEPISELV